MGQSATRFFACDSTMTSDANDAAPYASAAVVRASPTDAVTVPNRRMYQLGKLLGRGSSCSVYSVCECTTQQRFAMTVLPKSKHQNQGQFQTEIKLLSALAHPNVLKLMDSFEDVNNFYVVTELGKGGDLLDWIDHGPLSEHEAARITRGMLHAIAHCHKHNIVHRDLKPENFVFLSDDDDDGSLKLIDFGLAKKVHDKIRVRGVVGTPEYIAPEVINEKFDKCRTGALWKKADM